MWCPVNAARNSVLGVGILRLILHVHVLRYVCITVIYVIIGGIVVIVVLGVDILRLILHVRVLRYVWGGGIIVCM